MPTPTSLTWTLVNPTNGVKIDVTATQQASDVKFHIELASGVADLNGFFIDYTGNGGTVFRVGSNPADNMNGTAGFDDARELGTVGGNDPDYTSGDVLIPGTSLGDLIGALIGIRATSVGELREDSLKLVSGPPEPHYPPSTDNFPLFGQDISNVVLYFDAGAVGRDLDTKPTGSPDGFVLDKIDNVPSAAPDDLDGWIGSALTYLQANVDPDLSFANLLGAAIKGGLQPTLFYAVQGNTNGPASDPYPAGAPFATGNDNVTPTSIDLSQDYGTIFS